VKRGAVNPLDHLIQDNLEVFTADGGTYIRCARCQYVLSEFGSDWRIGCAKKYLPATKAGPLMQELTNDYALEQICCPACGALYSTELVEKNNASKE
jgi:hypothetical protein